MIDPEGEIEVVVIQVDRIPELSICQGIIRMQIDFSNAKPSIGSRSFAENNLVVTKPLRSIDLVIAAFPGSPSGLIGHGIQNGPRRIVIGPLQGPGLGRAVCGFEVLSYNTVTDDFGRSPEVITDKDVGQVILIGQPAAICPVVIVVEGIGCNQGCVRIGKGHIPPAGNGRVHSEVPGMPLPPGRIEYQGPVEIIHGVPGE